MTYSSQATRSGSLLLELALSLALCALLVALSLSLITLTFSPITHSLQVPLAVDKALYEILRELNHAHPIQKVFLPTLHRIEWHTKEGAYWVTYEKGRLALKTPTHTTTLLLQVDAVECTVMYQSPVLSVIRIALSVSAYVTSRTYTVYHHE